MAGNSICLSIRCEVIPVTRFDAKGARVRFPLPWMSAPDQER
jgi:hypothetical protein